LIWPIYLRTIGDIFGQDRHGWCGDVFGGSVTAASRSGTTAVKPEGKAEGSLDMGTLAETHLWLL